MQRWKALSWLGFMVGCLAACALPARGPTDATAVPLDTAIAATYQATQLQATTAAPIVPEQTSTVLPADPVPETSSTPTEAAQILATPAPAKDEFDLRIVYAKDEAIWLWETGHSPQALTQNGRPVGEVKISPDGAIVAFTRDLDTQSRDLWGVDTDGENLRRLISHEDLTKLGFDDQVPVLNQFEWSPSASALIFNTRRKGAGAGGQLNDDLYQVDARTGEISSLFPPGEGGEFVYSPDGGQIALVTPNQISLVNADGSNRRSRVLTYQTAPTYSEYRYYPQPVWSPDSSFLRVAIPPANPQVRPTLPTTLWRIPAAEGKSAIKEGLVNAALVFGANLAYAPTLEHLAYVNTAGSSAEEPFALYLANGDGSEAQIFTSGDYLTFESWATDGLHFAFGATETGALQIADLEGRFRPLNLMMEAAGETRAFDLQWVDERRFIYLLAVGNVWELHLGDLEGNDEMIDRVNQGRPNYDFAP